MTSFQNKEKLEWVSTYISKKEQGKNSKTSKRKAKLDMRQRDKH